MSDDSFAKWVPVTDAEIQAYLGFVILMGSTGCQLCGIIGIVIKPIITDQLLTAEIDSLESLDTFTLWTMQLSYLVIIRILTGSGK